MQDPEDTLIDDIRWSKRSLEGVSSPEGTSNPLPFSYSALQHITPDSPDQREELLEQCRDKLGLLFPPLDLGTNRILNITVGTDNKGCWNGTAVGAYIVDYFSPRHEVILPNKLLPSPICVGCLEAKSSDILSTMSQYSNIPILQCFPISEAGRCYRGARPEVVSVRKGMLPREGDASHEQCPPWPHDRSNLGISHCLTLLLLLLETH